MSKRESDFKNGSNVIDKMMSICAYCGGNANTLDHIPSRNLLKAAKSNTRPIIVPSCRECNGKYANDEDYFRVFITTMWYNRSLTATYLFDTAVGKSLKSNKKLLKSMIRKTALVDYYSKKGIYLGKKTIIKIEKEDEIKVMNVIDKYVKGLFYHHFKQIIPDDLKVSHKLITDDLEPKIMELYKVLKWYEIVENIFIYGFFPHPKLKVLMFCLVFFKSPLSISFVYRPDFVN